MPDWQESALILVGHGSSRNAAGRLPTLRLAAMLRRRDLFAEVRECFLKEPPFPGDILTTVSAVSAYVVPNFAGHGYLTREVVPRAMGLSGRVTLRSGAGPRRVLYTAPVGCHPRIPDILRRRVLAVLAGAGIPARAAGLLVIGHGSSRPGGSAETPEAVAAALREAGDFAEVRTAYLEQEPSVRDWPNLMRAPYVVAAPLLVAEGLHGGDDLPPLFGLAPGETGAGRIAGRLVWLGGGIGSVQEIADLVLEQVLACEAPSP